MFKTLRMAAGLALLLAPAAAVARQTTPPADPTPIAPAATTMQVPDSPDEQNPRALRLSLDEAIRATVENNLAVRLQQYDYLMSGQTARASYGLFDVYAFANLGIGDRQPAAEDAPNIENLEGGVGLRQNLPTGGSYSLRFDNTEVTVAEPAYSSDLGFNLNQPLLRDFGVDVNRRFINIARNNLGMSEEGFRNTLLIGVLAAEQAYYDLIFQRQNLEVRRLSLSLASDQERITRIRIDVGASAPLDILEPRVAIATREEEVIVAEARIRDAEDRLRRLMNLPASEWDRPIIPTDTIEFEPVDVDVEASVARAFELRPEIRQAGLGIENREIEYLYARNQVLPELDFNLNYGVAGLGGTQIIRDPVTNEPIGIVGGAFSDAIDQVFGFTYPTWSTSLTVGVPIRNISARAERRRAELGLERAVLDKNDIEQEIAIQVRQAVRDIRTSARQITASQAARDAAEQNLEAERRRFENGMSTNFDVLRVQQALADSQSREIAAVVAYNQALAAYHRAVGDLLPLRGIVVESRREEFNLPRSRFEDVEWLTYRHWAD